MRKRGNTKLLRRRNGKWVSKMDKPAEPKRANSK